MIKKIVFRQLNTLSISLLKILLEDFDIRTHEKFMFQKNVGWELDFDRYQYGDYSSLSKEGKSVEAGNIHITHTYFQFCELTSFQLKRVQLSCWKPLQKSQYRSFLVPLLQFSSKVATTVVYCFSTGQNGQMNGKKMSVTSLFFGSQPGVLAR